MKRGVNTDLLTPCCMNTCCEFPSGECLLSREVECPIPTILRVLQPIEFGSVKRRFYHVLSVFPCCKKKLALALYKRGILSSGKACALAGLSRWEWIELSGQRKIPRHYTAGDLENARAHVKRCQ